MRLDLLVLIRFSDFELSAALVPPQQAQSLKPLVLEILRCRDVICISVTHHLYTGFASETTPLSIHLT